MRGNVSGSVVAITGGARGIGLATAHALAVRGARVAVGDIDSDLARRRGAELGGIGLPLDVRSEDSFARFLALTEEALGPIDVLVNSAGVIVLGDFTTTAAAEQDVQLAVNLGGVMRGMRLALPTMLSRNRGRIVNVSSATGRIPAPRAAVYSASKHAVTALGEAVGTELRRTAVRVVSVHPTFATTEMAEGLATRGIPHVAADRVAAAIVQVIVRHRPPSRVMVPRWLSILAAVDASSPGWLRRAGRRLFTVDADPHRAARRAYERRIAQLTGVDPSLRSEQVGQERAEDGSAVLNHRGGTER